VKELPKAGAKYVHKETEAATLQQQLEAAKSAYPFMFLCVKSNSSYSLLTMYIVLQRLPLMQQKI